MRRTGSKGLRVSEPCTAPAMLLRLAHERAFPAIARAEAAFVAAVAGAYADADVHGPLAQLGAAAGHRFTSFGAPRRPDDDRRSRRQQLSRAALPRRFGQLQRCAGPGWGEHWAAERSAAGDRFRRFAFPGWLALVAPAPRRGVQPGTSTAASRSPFRLTAAGYPGGLRQRQRFVARFPKGLIQE